MTNSFDRFQDKMKRRTTAINTYNIQFLANGYPSIIIKSGDKEIQAVVVNKQEKDIAYIYTDLKNPLDIGSVWEAKSLHLLVLEEIVIIKNVQWRKYTASICNVQVDGEWGYFKSPQKASLDLAFDKTTLESTMHPLLAISSKLKFRDKIIINGRPWIVVEWDNITSSGVTYYSLEPTTIAKPQEVDLSLLKKEDKEENKEEKEIDDFSLIEKPKIYLVNPNTEISLSTEFGYFRPNKTIEVIKRTKDLVTFVIPFGIKEVIIETKKEGVIVKSIYNIK